MCSSVGRIMDLSGKERVYACQWDVDDLAPKTGSVFRRNEGLIWAGD